MFFHCYQTGIHDKQPQHKQPPTTKTISLPYSWEIYCIIVCNCNSFVSAGFMQLFPGFYDLLPSQVLCGKYLSVAVSISLHLLCHFSQSPYNIGMILSLFLDNNVHGTCTICNWGRMCWKEGFSSTRRPPCS